MSETKTAGTRPRSAWIALLGLAFLLAACSSDEDVSFACPPAVLVPNADRMVRFEGPGRDLTDVDFEVELEQPFIACSFDDDDYAIEADLRLRFTAERGPADADREAKFEYFVAIATAIGQRVVAREEFGLIIPFEGNRTRVAVVEQLEPKIPLRSTETGNEYRLFVGFKLSPEQMNYNKGR